ncbi:reticulocalbin-2-like [Pyrus x bretschneideri]|uniref:reticulocalbin-2-like n=1 Tax=Pyrus x bretschneideri TaxID=225117 RepID=UPI00202F140D|nr:reticulocalbin-2-like [Pyrus x bretschneideri]
MAKAVVYALLATAFIFLLVMLPSKHRGPNHPHPHLGLNRRLGYAGHAPIFDPLAAKMEWYAKESGGLRGETNSHVGLSEQNNNPMMNASEVEEMHEYLGDEGKLNLTLRLITLFPLIDQAPKDGLINSNELEDWVMKQTVERLNYRTQKEMESYDKDGDGTISFMEYLPKFSIKDLEINGMEHGEAGWWKQQFDNADADKNGLLNFNEFKDLLHPEDSNNEEIHKWLLREKMKRMDQDNDGKLNFQEFLHNAYDNYKTYVEFERGGKNVPTPEEKFAELDVNKNKLLEVEELKPMLHYIHPGEFSYAKYYATFLMSEADDNKDRKLTLEEMLDHDYVFYSTVYDDGINEDFDADFHDEF